MRIYQKLKRRLKWILTFSFMFIAFHTFSQDVDSRSPRPNSGSSQQKKADKKKAIQQKKIAKGIEKGRQRQLKIQTKNTKRMMRKSKRLSKKWNDKK